MFRFVPPTSSLHASWIEARDEWEAGEFMHGSAIRTAEGYDLDSLDGFTGWVENLLLQADPAYDHGIDRSPATNFWVVEDDASGAPRYLGSLQLRHHLTDFTRRFNGNIGYGVRPSARRRGVAGFALRSALPHARRLGLERVLVTCDEPNVGSARTITSCGGVLERTVPLDDDMRRNGFEHPVQRYWITV